MIRPVAVVGMVFCAHCDLPATNAVGIDRSGYVHPACASHAGRPVGSPRAALARKHARAVQDHLAEALAELAAVEGTTDTDTARESAALRSKLLNTYVDLARLLNPLIEAA